MASNNSAGDAPHGPLEQFEIVPLEPIQFGGLDLSFTNSALWMLIAVAMIAFVFGGGMRPRAIVPGRWQAAVELTYQFVANMLQDNVGPHGARYFPFIFTLFLFVLFGNLLGMIPYSFTYTSHIAVTFAMAAVVFVGVTVIGLARHGVRFFSLFVPSGVPAVLIPMMVVIEIISYFVRPISLSLRLFANMMAGHTMLKVFGGFVGLLISGGLGLLAPASIFLIVALTGFELLVAAIQAYVFAVLSCLYLRDALDLHH